MRICYFWGIVLSCCKVSDKGTENLLLRRKYTSSWIPIGIIPVGTRKASYLHPSWLPCAWMLSSLQSSLHMECEEIHAGIYVLKLYQSPACTCRLDWLPWLSLSKDRSRHLLKNNTKPILKCAILAAVWRCFFLLTKTIEWTFRTRIIRKGGKSHFKWLEMCHIMGHLENYSVSQCLPVCSRWVSPWKMVVQMSVLGK